MNYSATNFSAMPKSVGALPAWTSHCDSQLSVAFDRAQFPAPSPNHHGEGHMGISPAPYARRNRGEHSDNGQRIDTREATDWLKDQLRNKSAKEISADTGCGIRAAESIKLGRNGMTMAHLIAMCRNDPLFRAQFFRFAGGHLEGEPEMVAALSHAINAVLRSQT